MKERIKPTLKLLESKPPTKALALPKKSCEHHYSILRTVQEKVTGPGLTTWIRTDWFFCTKCLEEKSKTHREHSREHPAWWNQ